VELTNEDVADILALLDSTAYDELDLRTSRFRLTLRRTPNGWTQETQVTTEPDMAIEADVAGLRDGGHHPPPTEAPRGAASASERAPGAGAASLGAPRNERASTAKPHGQTATPAGVGGSKGGEAPLGNTAPLGNMVTTPLPGTFYRAPRPGAAPFVEIGTVVEPDTVVAIVETMKLMNSVPAGTRGTVAEILVANAESVGQGTALMRIKPA
jgi:acetyl-CoA carboxylase biotin carboxyl carrier protein